jgi:glycosyltransferase involved in cell wall biosynthesis
MLSEITPLILTCNEEPNIGRTLQKILWARRIVVIDTFSTDETVTIAKASHPNVVVFQRRFDTHATQWNFGLDQITTPWVLSLDADYELSSELIDELHQLQPADDVAGYEVQFEYRIFGRSLRSSVYPPHTVLFRPHRGHYHDEGHTQKLKIEGKVIPLIAKIYHDDRKPLSRWISSQDRYMIIETQHLLSTPLDQLSAQDRLRRKIFFSPAVMFLYLLFARRLILDGWHGWFYVCQRTIAEILLSLRLLIGRERLERTDGEAHLNDNRPPISTDRVEEL